MFTTFGHIWESQALKREDIAVYNTDGSLPGSCQGNYPYRTASKPR